MSPTKKLSKADSASYTMSPLGLLRTASLCAARIITRILGAAMSQLIQPPRVRNITHSSAHCFPAPRYNLSDPTALYTDLQALLWAINGNQTYADNAIKILNLYAHGLKGYGKSGTPPKPYNAPLQAAWSGMMYSKAAELLVHGGQNGTKSGWNTQDQQVFRCESPSAWSLLV